MRNIIAGFRNYANFGGRTSRKEFWIFALFFVVVTQLANWIDGLDNENVTLALRMAITELTVTLALILPMISASVRRLHDSNRSGWMILVMYLPYLSWLVSQGNAPGELLALGAFLIGFVAVVIQLALPGTPGENRFGRPPSP